MKLIARLLENLCSVLEGVFITILFLGVAPIAGLSWMIREWIDSWSVDL